MVGITRLGAFFLPNFQSEKISLWAYGIYPNIQL
nr:MAG TPA: hypothetical protein [Caudoviricetes sp.]